MIWEEWVAHVKSRISEMQPSNFEGIWSAPCKYYKYLLNLSSEDLKCIRFHTGLLTGLIPWRYWNTTPDNESEILVAKTDYDNATEDLAEKYWISEPSTLFGLPLGFEYKKRILNYDISRYQWCVALLAKTEVFNLERYQNKQIVIEIGGGYGGLANAIQTLLNGRITYVIVELPEILMFSAIYLKLLNPDKKMYIYGSDFDIEKILDYDFVLLPNYVDLNGIKKVHIGLNMWSFQEMTKEQVTKYLDFFKAKLGYCLYSLNLDKHPTNQSDFSVTQLLKERFQLYPDPESYEEQYNKENRPDYYRHKQYIAYKETN